MRGGAGSFTPSNFLQNIHHHVMRKTCPEYPESSHRAPAHKTIQEKIMSLFPWSNEELHHTTDLFNKGIGSNQFFKALENELPPVFTRKTASQAIGGLMSPKTMANLDALGQGPAVRVKLGSRTGYEKEEFLNWLRGRLRSW